MKLLLQRTHCLGMRAARRIDMPCSRPAKVAPRNLPEMATTKMAPRTRRNSATSTPSPREALRPVTMKNSGRKSRANRAFFILQCF